MAGNVVPDKAINYKIYNDSQDVIGTASLDLPEIAYMTDTISGAGIAGEVDSPVRGHFSSMTLTIHWRTVEKDLLLFTSHKAHTLDAYGSMQTYDSANGQYDSIPVHLSMRAVPKTGSLGSFEPGASTDSSMEFELVYLKIYVDGKEKVEIDKFNFIHKVDGEDLLGKVRQDLGMS